MGMFLTRLEQKKEVQHARVQYVTPAIKNLLFLSRLAFLRFFSLNHHFLLSSSTHQKLTLGDLLDKTCHKRLLSSPRYVLTISSRIGFSIPACQLFMLVDVSSNVANSRSCTFR